MTTYSIENLRDGLVAYLSAYAGLVALVGSDRIFPKVNPESRVLPSVTYDIQSGPRGHFAGTVIAMPYIKFTVWSSTHTSSWRIAEQLCQACEDYHGMLGTVHSRMWVDESHDGVYAEEPNPGVYPVNVFVRVWFRAS